MNPTILEKLSVLELSLSRDKGDFEFFGVILREDALEKWDLLVAAPWLDPNQRQSYKMLADLLQGTLSHNEYLEFSRIVILEKRNPFLEAADGSPSSNRTLLTE
jgi:hypothetical protein